jgi:hypothetical protein
MKINTEFQYYEDYKDLSNFLKRPIRNPEFNKIDSLQGCLIRVGSYNAELCLKIQQLELINDKLNKDILHLKKELEEKISEHSIKKYFDSM